MTNVSRLNGETMQELAGSEIDYAFSKITDEEPGTDFNY